MRLIPTVLLTSTGIAALVFGAGLLTQPDEDLSFEREDLPPLLVGTRLDAVASPADTLATAQISQPSTDGASGLASGSSPGSGETASVPTTPAGSAALVAGESSEGAPASGGSLAQADGDPFAPDSATQGGALGTGAAAGGAAADGDIIPLATLPGRDHTMGGYAAGTGNSDLPLEDGVELVAFDDLMLPDYVPPAVLDGEDDELRDTAELFPEEIATLDGERIALEGFMMPLEFSGNRVTAFVLSPYPPGCCFGGMPMLDEWVDVSLEDDEGVEYFAYRVVRVTGEFEVGEQLDDWGYVTSLYRMKSDKVEKLW